MTEKQMAFRKKVCTVGALCCTLFFILFLELCVGNISRVSGNSMYPTLHDGDVVIETQLRQPINGDIVSCASDINEEDGRIIKRVIAQEGDHLVISNNRVYVNDVALHEDYLHEPTFDGEVDIVIPKGMCFVMGDNRNHSIDSRDFGFISIEDITGIVLDVCIRKGDDRYAEDINN